jgi:hypothetical protein
MTVAGFVLVCALDLLGRSANQFPPIHIIDTRPAEASSHAVGFVRRGENAIYLIASSTPMQAAMESNRDRTRCAGLDVLRMIASVIVHEEWHLQHGADEQGAYYAQLTELQRLGSGPGRWPYENVRRSMQTAVARQARLNDPRQLASRATPGTGAAATLNATPALDPRWSRAWPETLLPPPRR